MVIVTFLHEQLPHYSMYTFLTCTYSYRKHVLIKFLERKRAQAQKDRSEPREAGGSNEHGENNVTNDVGNRNGGVEETDFVCLDNEGTDTLRLSIKNQKALPHQRHTSMMAGIQEYPETPIERPSLCCVLIGRHWSMALSKGML